MKTRLNKYSPQWHIALALGAIAGFLAISCSSPKSKGQTQFNAEYYKTFAIKRGVNISHWLSQSNQRGAARKGFFTKKDVDFIASIGYDHIRIPIDEEQMWDEKGNKIPEAFSLLRQAVTWASDTGLRVVVDLHILRSHYFNAKVKPLWTKPEAQERFYQCWRDLSGELHEYPNGFLAYELMNEPVADDPEQWNQLVAKCMAVIREKEPERKIIVGSNRWQSVDTFDQLKVPAGDRNIILSFHFYIPFLLTHHEASWTDIKDYKGPVHYPGLIVEDEDLAGLPDALYARMKRDQKTYNRDSLEALMMKPIKRAKELGLELYCGEWGCITNAPTKDRLRWYADVRYCLEKNHIAWTNWDYKSNSFGIVDPTQNNAPDQDLIKVLVGKHLE